MSQRHDYLASPLPARAGMSRLGIGIGAALAVVIVAGIGGILVAQQGERPGGGIVKLGSSEAAPTPAGPSGIPNAANAPRPTAVKAPAQAPANAPAQAQAPANVPAAATRPQAAGSFPPACTAWTRQRATGRSTSRWLAPPMTRASQWQSGRQPRSVTSSRSAVATSAVTGEHARTSTPRASTSIRRSSTRPWRSISVHRSKRGLLSMPTDPAWSAPCQ